MKAADGIGLDNTATYTGSFHGTFFGPTEEEVGAVFDFTSADKKAGAFRGSFGARDREAR